MEVEDFQDLIRLLQARPEWRADLRRVVLTDELLALPEQIARLQVETDRRFHELAEAQRRTEERVAALAEAQNRINEQIAALTRVVYALTEDVRVLKIDVGDLKGDNLERRYREKAPAYFGRLVRRMRVLSAEELAGLLEDAVEQGQLTDAEKDEAILTDVVVRGRYQGSGAEVYLVVEVSWGVGVHDVERAVQRAAVLGKLGIPALPVVAGKAVTAQAEQLAHEQHVWQVINGQAVSPQSAAPPS
ncbi:MAG TPA: hypothetical protein VE844_21860 [Gammaproteobacteria bacterium]|nr:hypothetical protein [Gammaproteobacteria bacterium]